MKKQGKELGNIINFFQTAGKLKEVKRQGWLVKGVKDSESVADHSFMLALMAMLFAEEEKLDANKAMRMALVHDLPEALCGDIASRAKEEQQQCSNKEKHEREEKALKEILLNMDSKTKKEIS
ncbi:MAG: HD domain-containing protein, partial [Candidatus Diapherotrites archaeon]|nr:HD domain-containing protein [Candidatus Diapherotrites archaeon]